MPGAVVLAATAALRAGAGKLQTAVGRSIAPLIAQAVPEALVAGLAETKSGHFAPASSGRLEELAAEAAAALVGPGVLEGSAVGRLLCLLVDAMRGTLVADAAALLPFGRTRALSPRLRGRAALTPHAGELAAMTGEDKGAIERHPQAAALRAAKTFSAVVALKGAETFIADPAGRVWLNRAGNVGLATSRSGDTLSGIAAGIAARGAPPAQAAAWAVALHARAGDRLARRMGPLGFLPRELLKEIPPLTAELSKGS